MPSSYLQDLLVDVKTCRKTLYILIPHRTVHDAHSKPPRVMDLLPQKLPSIPFDVIHSPLSLRHIVPLSIEHQH